MTFFFFENLVKYSKQYPIHSETIYFYYLIENKKLNIVYIPFYFVRIRLTGNAPACGSGGGLNLAEGDYDIYKIFNDNKYNEKILDYFNYSNYPHRIIEMNTINENPLAALPRLHGDILGTSSAPDGAKWPSPASRLELGKKIRRMILFYQIW